MRPLAVENMHESLSVFFRLHRLYRCRLLIVGAAGGRPESGWAFARISARGGSRRCAETRQPAHAERNGTVPEPGKIRYCQPLRDAGPGQDLRHPESTGSGRRRGRRRGGGGLRLRRRKPARGVAGGCGESRTACSACSAQGRALRGRGRRGYRRGGESVRARCAAITRQGNARAGRRGSPALRLRSVEGTAHRGTGDVAAAFAFEKAWTGFCSTRGRRPARACRAATP